MNKKQTLILLIAFILFSCTKHENNSVAKRIVISGQVLNHNPQNPKVKINVNRTGLNSLKLTTELDSLGNFVAVFKNYTPTDVAIRYRELFYITANPEDSIFVRFDAQSNSTSSFYNSIRVHGDNVVTNTNIIRFQSVYFSSDMYNNWDGKKRAVKELSSADYLKYLEKKQHQSDSLVGNIMKHNASNKRAIEWAKYYISQEYYNALFRYPFCHALYNKQPTNEYCVPEGYYDTIANCLPIKNLKNIYGFAFSDFVENYSCYISSKWKSEKQNQKYHKGRNFSMPLDIADSIDVYSIIKYTPGTLLRQIVLTKKFSDDFCKYSEIECFEKYQDVVDKYIRLPYLRKPLYEQYSRLKKQLENPEPLANLFTREDLSISQLINSITHNNKGKIIYVDCWATWCGPCKMEMANSKKLMAEMTGKDVEFVYLCLHSEKKKWKQNLSELGVGGQHYFLSRQQSNEINKAFEIRGIPFYILIDKNGYIVEKGSHIRPNIASYKIKELLKK